MLKHNKWGNKQLCFLSISTLNINFFVNSTRFDTYERRTTFDKSTVQRAVLVHYQMKD